MKIKELFYDTLHFKKPAIYLAMSECDWKCCKEAERQDASCPYGMFANAQGDDVSAEEIIRDYASSSSEAVVFGGLEPFLQFDDVLQFVKAFREDYSYDDDIVIYTGYYPFEVFDKAQQLEQYKNIYIKWGRYHWDSSVVWDETLGVQLKSDNQFGDKIS